MLMPAEVNNNKLVLVRYSILVLMPIHEISTILWPSSCSSVISTKSLFLEKDCSLVLHSSLRYAQNH